jgi:hypothetical protein
MRIPPGNSKDSKMPRGASPGERRGGRPPGGRNPPRGCVSLLMGTPRRAGPPYGLPAQATTRGVNFGRR